MTGWASASDRRRISQPAFEEPARFELLARRRTACARRCSTCLPHAIADCVFLDVYAGTGAVGIEALSRGARRAIFIEKNRAAVEVIRENLAALGIESRAEVFTSKAATVLERAAADIAFLDPPYEMSKEYEASMAALDQSGTPLVIIQHSSHFRRRKPTELCGAIARSSKATIA